MEKKKQQKEECNERKKEKKRKKEKEKWNGPGFTTTKTKLLIIQFLMILNSYLLPILFNFFYIFNIFSFLQLTYI